MNYEEKVIIGLLVWTQHNGKMCPAILWSDEPGKAPPLDDYTKRHKLAEHMIYRQDYFISLEAAVRQHPAPVIAEAA